MRHRAHGYRTGALQREVLPGSDRFHPVRYRGGVSVSLGGGIPRAEDVRLYRDALVPRADRVGVHLHLEERRAGLVERAPGAADGDEQINASRPTETQSATPPPRTPPPAPRPHAPPR